MNRRLRRAVVVTLDLFLLITAIALVSVVASAGEPAAGRVYTVHAADLPDGAPPTNIALFGHLYAISLNPDTKIADWCCYRATAAVGASRNAIERNWINGLEEATLEHQDYSKSGYDMGHLAPLATFNAERHAYELNFMANIAPQRPDLNRGPWLQLETLVRRTAETSAYVDVIVGPLYEKRMPKLPGAEESHRVPSHYWAIIQPREQPAAGYVIPQDCGRKDPLSDFEVPVTLIEQRSGLRFGGD